ncbi:adenylate/guanylate cyclase domain-containing protein [Nocardioides donggukensis]|uniref:Adenylate/guanylate cyclase domain-containing protein n=1 Tax=Nocardioides donggukensis TaxID=2774019 RepID=A0A927K9C5_9ACTN|nr:adenylate/guanylate cyclase domain-containing protein [Nocardioides donggukensis]MBD8870161.1 adenylate/guanylate cyclase domain-containing protein [Nocardioides donggukensis]
MPSLTLALTVALLVTLAGLGLVAARLGRAEREIRMLRSQLEHSRRGLTRQAAGAALRTVVGTAVRVREQGVGGFLTSSIEELTGIALAQRSEIVRIAGPDGTVTVLFSDIQDSTAMNESLGDPAWMKVLAAHDHLVRRHVERHGGAIVKSQGDGFMVVFGTPQAALRAAIGVQESLAAGHARRLRRTPVAVRMGLHTGPTIEKDGDYFGRNVAFAARVAGQADGGEILVSEAVHALLAGASDGDVDRASHGASHGASDGASDGDVTGAGEPAGEFTFVDLREASLKGFPGEHRLWELAWP